MWFKYPYTSYSELNLDWFLQQFKELLEAWDAQKVDYEQFKLDVTTEFNTLSGKFDDLKEVVDTFTAFVTNYFNNLDVQQEINNKLDAMAADGSLDTLLEPLVASKVPAAVTAWLNDNVDPVGSAVLVDSTLSIAGAAADAKVTGDDIRDLQDAYEVTHYEPVNLLDWNDVDIGAFYWTNGRNTNASYNATGYIPVTEGMHLYLQYGQEFMPNRTNGNFRFVAAYDSDKNIIANECVQSVPYYEVPEGVSFVIFSLVSNILTSEKYPVILDSDDGTVIDYQPYFEPYTTKILKEPYYDVPYIKSIVEDTKHFKNGIYAKFDINSDDHILSDYHIQDMFNYSITFRGTITTFNGIIIGHGYNSYMGGYVRITDTDFEYYMGTEVSPRVSTAHGLTIKDYISVEIIAKRNFKADFIIHTNGGIFTLLNQTWDVRTGYLQVKNEGTNVLTDCMLSYMCSDWNDDIQIYGDSYIGVYSDKWTYYLNDGFLQNGYPGRTSGYAAQSFDTVISHTDPKMIIWCLGMNDGDTGAVNPSWKSNLEHVMEVCADRNIQLILATIPNVPTVDNTYKNAYVIASGYRYIDFASAVGAANDTTWFDGMLSNDNVHPSIAGAIALYTQAIADVPELMA